MCLSTWVQTKRQRRERVLETAYHTYTAPLTNLREPISKALISGYLCKPSMTRNSTAIIIEMTAWVYDPEGGVGWAVKKAFFFSLVTTDQTGHLSKGRLLTFCSEPKQNAARPNSPPFQRSRIECLVGWCVPFVPLCVAVWSGLSDWCICMGIHCSCWWFNGTDSLPGVQVGWDNFLQVQSTALLCLCHYRHAVSHGVTMAEELKCNSTHLLISLAYIMANISLSNICLHQHMPADR